MSDDQCEDSREDLQEIHKYGMKNRDSVESPGVELGCFFCLTIFSLNGLKVAKKGSGRCWVRGPFEELEWVDDDDTLLCPFCGIDSVLSSADVPITPELLADMHTYFFNRPE